MLPVEEAQQRVLAEIETLEAEPVGFLESFGRILREDISAPEDVPQADNTAMDGYAVLADDIATATDQQAVSLRVIEDLPAGTVAREKVVPGTAIRIMTGALLPEGCDVVAHVEITDAGSDTVRVFRPLKRGTNIRRRGEDMMRGDIVLHSGMPIGAAGRRWRFSRQATRSSTSMRRARRARSSTRTPTPWPRLCARRARCPG